MTPKKRGRPKGTVAKGKVRPLPTNKAGDKALIAMAGHNRGSSQFLLRVVKEAEKLEDQKRALGKAVNGLLGEAKQNGFSVQAIRAVMRLRRMDKDERAHHEENVAIVKEALGEQLTMFDREVMERADAPKKAAPDPSAVAKVKAAASSAMAESAPENPVH